LAKIGVESAYPLDGGYTLTADIELANWIPIGADGSHPFTGTFDGNSKTITITSFGSGLSYPYAGIFGYTDGAVLKNSTIAGAVTVTWNNAEETAHFIGALAGYSKNTEISFCTSAAGITASSLAGPVYAGGLAGYSFASAITNCATTGNVTAEGKGHNAAAGGIAGYNTKGTTVSDSSAAGNISLIAVDGESRTDQAYLYMVYAGGLLGYTGDSSVTTGSHASGAVYVKAPFPYAGGLVGYNYGTLTGSGVGSVIKKSYAAGSATAEAVVQGLPYAGGLAGYNSGDQTTIENCYASGTVLATSNGGLGWAGGVAGANANHALISKSYSRSAVTVQIGTGALPYPMPGVSEGACAGGIAGYNYFTPDTKIAYCAALNAGIQGTAGNNNYALHRVAGRNGDSLITPTLLNNSANEAMTITPAPVWDKTANGVDGADTAQPPMQSDYTALGWDFNTVWKMGVNGYPVFK
jgi:hypothetical protein